MSAPISIIPVLLLISIVALTLFILWERHRGCNGPHAVLFFCVTSTKQFQCA